MLTSRSTLILIVSVGITCGGLMAADIDAGKNILDDVSVKIDDGSDDANPKELHFDYWWKRGQEVLKRHLSDFDDEHHDDAGIGSSAVLVIGAGMSLTTIRGAGIYKAQADKSDTSLFFERFPVTGFAKPYCADLQVGDASCTATAYLGGFKGRRGVVGLLPTAETTGCKTESSIDNMESIAKWALAAGKDVGIVTTGRITHASVSNIYAHGTNSAWEADVDVPNSCPDFAYQLVNSEPGKHFKVILGGGRSNFLPIGVDKGRRNDATNLIKKWKDDKKNRGLKYSYVTDKYDLFQISRDTEYLLGLFASDNLDYHLLADELQPSLDIMVEAALKILSNNKNGYFLFVLGNGINDAHENNQARIALDETIELSKAVDTISKMTHKKTLIVVTADHGSSMTISGYSSRWNDILGISNDFRFNYTQSTISYATGPGFKKGFSFESSSAYYANIADPEFKYPATVNLAKESHGGEDVPVFVKGPWQEIFTGQYGSEVLPHMIGFAICIGPGEHSCESSAGKIASLNLALFILFLFIFTKIFLKNTF